MARKATKKPAAAKTPAKKPAANKTAKPAAAKKAAAPASATKFDQSGAPWWKKFWPTQPTAGKR